jgi:hypothetical protein
MRIFSGGSRFECRFQARLVKVRVLSYFSQTLRMQILQQDVVHNRPRAVTSASLLILLNSAVLEFVSLNKWRIFLHFRREGWCYGGTLDF